MSRDMSMPSAQVEVFAVQRRRRFSAEEKQRLVQETLQPGMTISLVAPSSAQALSQSAVSVAQVIQRRRFKCRWCR
jgi:transposase